MIEALAGIDYGILGICSFSALVSLMRGFVKEALSLATWVIAFWIGFHFTNPLADLLANVVKSHTLRIPLAFAILFITTLLLGALANFLIAQLVVKTGLSNTDRLLGIVFGILRGLLVIAVLLLMGRLTTTLPQAPWWRSSAFVPYFEPLEIYLQGYMPKTVDTKLVESE
jgi:membrane protein required for colicin V production